MLPKNQSIRPSALLKSRMTVCRGFLVTAWVLSTLATGNCRAQDEISREQVAFFEKEIRPVLIAECYQCHSIESARDGKLRGGLLLDSKQGILTGGDSGPAVMPGEVGKSLILSALNYESFEMPPGGKLSDEVIAAFSKWVKLGAPDPREGVGEVPSPAREIDYEGGRKFWSFQPLRAITPAPSSINPDANPIDRFVNEKHEELGLQMSGLADPRVLIRRAWFDLLGIPPEPKEMKFWMNELAGPADSPIPLDRLAWGRLIDHLLERPEYGERWARHWMDVARFAESHGYEQDYDRPNAYHYRDFLIRAFNCDLPYEKFVQWQIAGDELEPSRPDAWMATGFLGAGAFPTQLTETEFESARYDELDDMVSTTGVTVMGLSIGCARCHDHKFDPISTVDYYRFASTFTSVIRSEKIFDLEPEANEERRREYAQAMADARNDLGHFESAQLVELFIDWLKTTSLDDSNVGRWEILSGKLISTKGTIFELREDGSYLAVGPAPNQDVYKFEVPPGMRKLQAIRIEALTDASLPKMGPGRAANGNFALGNFELSISDDQGSIRPVAISSALATHQQNTDSLSIAASIDSDPISGWAVDGQIGKSQAAVFLLPEPLELDVSQSLTITLAFQHPNNQHSMGRVRFSTATDVDVVPEPGGIEPSPQQLESLRRLQKILKSTGKLSPNRETDLQIAIEWFQRQSSEWVALRKRADELEQTGPAVTLAKVLVTSEGLPHLAHHADDRGFPHFYPETYVLRRGDVSQKVELAKPGFPKVLVHDSDNGIHWQPDSTPGGNAESSYRRAALAMWLTDSKQGAGALAARVMVNRLWQHHFGRGIVATPNDFGTTGERPSHPELLEWLATRLVDGGGRLKPIHRAIMTSDTYLQSNKATNDPRSTIDPENRLLWYRAPRRLEAEAIRDTMLAVSGLLDRTMFGPGTLDPNMKRRSVYFFIKRSQLIPSMMLFDWPEHLVSIGQRQSTTTAPQALMFINSELGRACAEALAGRALQSDPNETLLQVYQIAFGRAPSDVETTAATEFLQRTVQIRSAQGDTDSTGNALVDLCQMILGLNEFIYVD